MMCICTFHSMKNTHRLLVNNIIHYLQQIGIAVKPYQQMLRGIIHNDIVIPPVQYSMANVRLGNAMFERRGSIFDNDVHGGKCSMEQREWGGERWKALSGASTGGIMGEGRNSMVSGDCCSSQSNNTYCKAAHASKKGDTFLFAAGCLT